MPHPINPTPFDSNTIAVGSSDRPEFAARSTESPVGAAIEVLNARFEADCVELHRFACSFLHDHHLAEDVVQQTYINTVEAIKRGAAIENHAAWLRRCVRNLCMDQLRRTTADSLDDHEEPTSPATPAAIVDRREQLKEIHKAVDRMPDHMRSAFLLAELRGLNYREIAVLLERSASATAQILYRARSHVRALADEGRLAIFAPISGWGLSIRPVRWLQNLTSRIAAALNTAGSWLSASVHPIADRVVLVIAAHAAVAVTVVGIGDQVTPAATAQVFEGAQLVLQNDRIGSNPLATYDPRPARQEPGEAVEPPTPVTPGTDPGTPTTCAASTRSWHARARAASSCGGSPSTGCAITASATSDEIADSCSSGTNPGASSADSDSDTAEKETSAQAPERSAPWNPMSGDPAPSLYALLMVVTDGNPPPEPSIGPDGRREHPYWEQQWALKAPDLVPSPPPAVIRRRTEAHRAVADEAPPPAPAAAAQLAPPSAPDLAAASPPASADTQAPAPEAAGDAQQQEPAAPAQELPDDGGNAAGE